MGQLGKLHVVTDDVAVAVAALRAGAPVLQVRVKDAADPDVHDLVRRVQAVAATTGATVVVNDRVHLAAATGAGAHVGADDLPVAAARRLLGPHAVLGATARDVDTARRHEADGATYLGVGPAYRTATKAGLPDPLGAAQVGAIARAVAIPVIAIAGVTPDRVAELLAVGAHGVAVVSGISSAPDPAAATAAYLAALDAAAAS